MHRSPLQKRPDSYESNQLAIGRYQTKFSENQRGLRLSTESVRRPSQHRLGKFLGGFYQTQKTRQRCELNPVGAGPRQPHDGGADRDRTDDLRLAKPALSQLSYSPVKGDAVAQEQDRREGGGAGAPPTHTTVGQGRLELPTSRLSGVRSNHLSYWPGWQGLSLADSPTADHVFEGKNSRSLKTESYYL